MDIMFGEYLPDIPDFKNPGLTEAKNVMPYGESYLPFPSLSVYSSNALSARCQGMVYGKDADGNTFNFAGDETKLYRLSGAAYSDVSKVGGYSTANDGMWYFSTYGQRMLATNFNDAIQNFTMGTSSAFADLAASAPKARYITALNDFIVAGNTFDSVEGNVPHRVRWCGIGDPTSWTVSPTTQADYQDLDSSKGWVQQVVGGEFGVIFQERAISRMSYVGSPLVFQFNEVESKRGLFAPGSAIKVGNFVAYIGPDGFYIFDGNQSIPIGENKINKTFFDEVDLSYIDRITADVDVNKQIIRWAYAASGNTGGRSNKIIMFNYAPNAKKRWSYAEVDIDVLGTSLSEGYTIDSLDSLSGSIDALQFSLDSRVYTGNNYISSAINSDHKLANFTGTAQTAMIETGEMQISDGGRTLLTLLRPLIDGTGTVTVQIGTRNNLSDSVTWSSAISANSINEFPTRSNARYHRFRVNIASGFNHAQGIQLLKAAYAGRR